MYNFSQYVGKFILCVNGLLVQCVSMLQRLPLFLHRNSVDKILKIVVGSWNFSWYLSIIQHWYQNLQNYEKKENIYIHFSFVI